MGRGDDFRLSDLDMVKNEWFKIDIALRCTYVLQKYIHSTRRRTVGQIRQKCKETSN